MPSSIGFTLPFTVATGSLGYFETTKTEFDAIKANIISLLVTNWGERPMHYRFGCNLIEFLFEPESEQELKLKIADRILDQVKTWLSFITIENLNIFLSSDSPEVPEHGIAVRIAFRLNSRPDILSLLEHLIT